MRVIQNVTPELWGSGIVQGHFNHQRGALLPYLTAHSLPHIALWLTLCIMSSFIIIWSTDMLAVVSEILERGVNINLYMFHGGTSFGFMNGAMDFGTYKPQVTSYGW